MTGQTYGPGAPHLYIGGGEYDPALAALLAQPWSNNVCRGYVIYAMENCGFSAGDIRRVVAELYEVFDCRGLEEAEAHFLDSPY